MAIVSAALGSLVALGTAIGTGAGAAAIGTAAAVAAVNVGTLVGVVGMGMSVIGMATGNKTLSKIGGYLGMAGGVMTIGGGLAGGMAGAMKNISTAWDDGVGSLFSATKPVGGQALTSGQLQEKLGQSIVDNSLAQQAAAKTTMVPPTAPSTAPSGPSVNLGPRPQLTPPLSASQGATQGGVNPLDFAGKTVGGAGAVRPDLSATQFANVAPLAAPNSTAGMAQVTANANVAPGAGANMPPMGLENWPTYAKVGVDRAAETASNFWSSLPDWAKGTVATSGVQGLSGMMGGWFESATAEEKLALEREAQQWRQQHEDRGQAFAQRNASFAPRVTFGGTGILSRGRSV